MVATYSVTFLCALTSAGITKMSVKREKTACVLVLGDFGRSPRMQYHTQSLLEEDFDVDVISFFDSPPQQSILQSRNVQLHSLYKFPEFGLPNAIKYIFKTLWQTLALFIALLMIRKPNFILVQNPPAVPTMFVCYLYCKVRRVHFVVDWHNYAYSILALNSNPHGFFVRCTKWVERYFGAKAAINFCVTKAMQADLKKNWNIEAIVLYDRPAEQFHPVSLAKRHDLFVKLGKDYPQFLSEEANSTACSQKLSDGTIVLRNERPAILVSSTSWTPDEDFGILLAALQEYDESIGHDSSYPKILCIITGKGPEKEFYCEKIKTINWKHISIITPWLESEDYPTLLASADLGVCLHQSSSGLDLPMKVVDMFGCGLPVCAINFNCLSELVLHETNGFIFEDSHQLAQQIKSWFEHFPNNSDVKEILKQTFHQSLEEFQNKRWRENWKFVALPALSDL